MACLESCSVCTEEFSEGISAPRILSCSHTFCTKCLGKILKADKKCPTCREYISNSHVLDIPYNRFQMEIIDDFSPAAKRQKRCNGITTDYIGGEKYLSIGTCHEHNAPLQFRCIPSKKWICGICHVKSHKSSNCKVVLISDALQELQKDNIDWIEAQEKSLNDQINDLQELVDVTKQNILARTKQLSEAKSAQNCLMAKIRYLSEKKCKNCKLKDEVMKKPKLDEILRKQKNVSGLIKSFLKELSFSINEDNDLEPVSVSKELGSFFSSVDLYARFDWLETDKFCQLEKRGPDIFVHCLTEQPPPEGAVIFPYSAVAPLIPREEGESISKPLPRAFMTIEVEGLSLGQVVFKMDRDSQRARNFLILCSGQCEENYADSLLFKGIPSIIVGGWEILKETGGVAVQGILDSDYQETRSGGRLCGRKVNIGDLSGFFIIHRDLTTWHGPFLSFGSVEKGLPILHKADDDARNLKEVRVSKCGLVITS